jgi:hypothetical protein
VRFARALPEDSPYAAREALARKDAHTLARELLGMTHPAFSAAFPDPLVREHAAWALAPLRQR